MTFDPVEMAVIYTGSKVILHMLVAEGDPGNETNGISRQAQNRDSLVPRKVGL